MMRMEFLLLDHFSRWWDSQATSSGAKLRCSKELFVGSILTVCFGVFWQSFFRSINCRKYRKKGGRMVRRGDWWKWKFNWLAIQLVQFHEFNYRMNRSIFLQKICTNKQFWWLVPQEIFQWTTSRWSDGNQKSSCSKSSTIETGQYFFFFNPNISQQIKSHPIPILFCFILAQNFFVPLKDPEV